MRLVLVFTLVWPQAFPEGSVAVPDRLRTTIALVLVTALLAGCGPSRVPSHTGPTPTFYHVRPGDTLFSIGQRFGVDPDKIQRWNGVEDPTDLKVGSKLRLRPVRVKNGPQAAKAEKAATGQGPPSASLQDGPKEWQWPVGGRILNGFAKGDQRNGIDIAAREGSPVRAAADGEVVYSGDGLRGYGNLVILRHQGEFITTYAYNREILVGEGDRVQAGQAIARAGQTGNASEPSLHFEVRHRTEPIDPLRVLPER